MNFEEIKNLESRLFAHTFSRLPVAIARGSGMYLWDVDDKKYLDMFSGIAVNSVGNCHPKVVKAIKEQAQTLMHVSNWLYTVPQLKLAGELIRITGQEKIFITNDGTEAVECAIKLARKSTGKKEIIAMEGAFHGRTLGSLSITWGEKYRTPFQPLVAGMKFVGYNNVDAVKSAITDDTAAVIVEPIQGESGVIVPDEGYLTGLRELTHEKNVLLIVDEVQTGFGRTGKMFAYEHEGVKPDILCLAKALGGGFPIGATLFNGMDFEPGQHGGTMIGNPLACAAALASIRVIKEDKLVENSQKMGNYLMKNLDGARGKGLMVGIETPSPEKKVLELIEEGVLAIYSKDAIRALPPLIIEKNHIDTFLNAMEVIMNGR